MKCKSQIIQIIADLHLKYTKDKRTAFDIRTELKTVFECCGIESQLFLRKKLFLTKCKLSAKTLSSYFLKFKTLVREIKFIGNYKEPKCILSIFNSATRIRRSNNGVRNTIKRSVDAELHEKRLLDEKAKQKEDGKSTKNETSYFTAFTLSANDNRKTYTQYRK